MITNHWQCGTGKIWHRVLIICEQYFQRGEANSRPALRKFSGATTSVLALESTVFFFEIFLGCHRDSEILYSDEIRHIVTNALVLIRTIQRPSHINVQPSWWHNDHTVVWSMRACQSKSITMRQAKPEALGFKLYRERGWIGPTNRRTGFAFQEWRSTTCAYTILDDQSHTAVGSVMSWFDNNEESIHVDDPHYDLLDEWLPRCGKDGGTYLSFCEHLIEACHYWYNVWTGTLDMIDDLVSVKVSISIVAAGMYERHSSRYFLLADKADVQPSDTLDRDRWQTLMFDSEFQVSETYFSVLQMLRIFSDWIEETEAEWRLVYVRVTMSSYCLSKKTLGGDQTSHPIVKEEILVKNLQEVKKNLKRLAARLKGRIEKKKTEVESLRDGVSIPSVPIIMIFFTGSC